MPVSCKLLVILLVTVLNDAQHYEDNAVDKFGVSPNHLLHKQLQWY